MTIYVLLSISSEYCNLSLHNFLLYIFMKESKEILHAIGWLENEHIIIFK